MEENLRAKESFITNIDGELLPSDGMNTFVLLYPLGKVVVVLVELLHDIGTNVTKSLLKIK